MTIISIAVIASVYMATLFLLCHYYSSILWPLLAGGVLRLVLAVALALGWVSFPGTRADAVTFERRAREWSDLPWREFLDMFNPGASYVISWVGALLYKLLAHSPVILNLFNALISLLLIVVTYRLAVSLFGRSRGIAAAWVVALFPFAILYGSIFRREVFGSFLFMLGVLASVRWVRKKSGVYFALALLMFGAAGVFHGGYIFGAVGLVLFTALVPLMREFRRRAFSIKTLWATGVALAVVLFALAVVAAQDARLNKLGNLNAFDPRQAITGRVERRMSTGDTSYPDLLRGRDPFRYPYVIPGRIAYFLISPFPWDIQRPEHAIGLVASIMYLLILVSIFRSRKLIFRSQAALLVAFIVAVPVIVFGISIDNVGTSIRHRTKFLYPLVALCAVPLLGRRRWRIKHAVSAQCSQRTQVSKCPKINSDL